MLLDLRELGVIGGDDDITSQRDFERGREAKSLNGADDWNVQAFQPRANRESFAENWRAPLLLTPTKVVFTFTPQPK